MRGIHPGLHEPRPLPSIANRPFYAWLIVGTVCVGAFLGQLDASIAGLVLPTLEETFAAPVASVAWVAIAYLVALAAFVVPFGRLADLAGRKLLYTGGFVVFIIGSALCGFAPDLGWLIAFRVLQAIGAAMLQANSVAIITSAVVRRRLGRAIGIQGAAQAVGLSIGPSVGGFLIDALGWRWVFFIAVPFGVLGTLLAWFVLPCSSPAEQSQASNERFDWLGALLLGPSVVLMLLALTFANDWGWTSPMFLGVSMAAALCVGLFLTAERRAESALVDMRLFCSRTFSVGILAGLLSYAVLFGSLFVVPFYLERGLGLSPAQAGLFLSPVPLALGVMAPVAGLLTDRFGSRAPTVAGMLLSGSALVALAIVGRAETVVMLGLLGVLGVGLGLFTPPNNSAIMGSAPTNRLGVAGGILNMTRSLGTSLGVALTGALLAALLSAELGGHVESTLSVEPVVLQVAVQQTLVCLAALAAVAGLVRDARSAGHARGARRAARGDDRNARRVA